MSNKYKPWQVIIEQSFTSYHVFRRFRYKWQARLFAKYLQQFTEHYVYIFRPASEKTIREVIKRMEATRQNDTITLGYLQAMTEKLLSYKIPSDEEIQNQQEGMFEKLKRHPLIARIYRHLYPEYGTCGCCALPWNKVEIHHISVTPDLGYFAFCEYCFRHRSFEEMNKAVSDLWQRWLDDNQRPVFSRIEIETAFVKDYCDTRNQETK